MNSPPADVVIRRARTADVKAILKTMEGVTWTTAPEPKKPMPRKP